MNNTGSAVERGSDEGKNAIFVNNTITRIMTARQSGRCILMHQQFRNSRQKITELYSNNKTDFSIFGLPCKLIIFHLDDRRGRVSGAVRAFCRLVGLAILHFITPLAACVWVFFFVFGCFVKPSVLCKHRLADIRMNQISHRPKHTKPEQTVHKQRSVYSNTMSELMALLLSWCGLSCVGYRTAILSLK